MLNCSFLSTFIVTVYPNQTHMRRYVRYALPRPATVFLTAIPRLEAPYFHIAVRKVDWGNRLLQVFSCQLEQGLPLIRVLFYSREIRCRSFSIGDCSLDSLAAAARARDGHALQYASLSISGTAVYTTVLEYVVLATWVGSHYLGTAASNSRRCVTYSCSLGVLVA
jgi:hypothetical protein